MILNNGFAGCQIDVDYHNTNYCGQIKEHENIRLQNGVVIIEFDWYAVMKPNGGWKKYKKDRMTFSGNKYPPTTLMGGFVKFVFGTDTVAVLCPKTTMLVDPSIVEGLVLPPSK